MAVHTELAIVGAGHLASALVCGLVDSGMAAGAIVVASPQGRSSGALAAQFGVRAAGDNAQAAAEAPTLVLAVRPAQVAAVLQELGAALHERLLISVAAGITCARLGQLAPDSTAVCRAMPNLGIRRRTGFIGCCSPKDAPQWRADSRLQKRVEALFGRVGETAWVEEELMDAVTAVAGSGPGLTFEFARCLTLAGEQAGLEGEQVRAMVTSVLRTCADLLLESPNPGAWRDQVASAGGTTEAGLRSLQQADLPQLLQRAVDAARRRAAQLAASQ